jgi:hypothetical protein
MMMPSQDSSLNPGRCTQVESKIITTLTKIPNMLSKLNSFPTLVKSNIHATENSNMHVTEYSNMHVEAEYSNMHVTEYSNMHVEAEYSNTHRLLNIPTHIG